MLFQQKTGPVSPLTGGSEVTLIERIPAQKLVDNFKVTYGFNISDEFIGIDEIQVYRCNQTGLVFFAPEEAVGSEKLYQHLQTIPWYYSTNKWEHRYAIQELQGCHNILEIGSGSGQFVELAGRAGLNIRGIEINSTAVEEAHEKGLPVELLDLHIATSQYPEHFDAVCSFQVLEHVPNPGEFIKWSLQILKPGGKLIFCVPNADSFIKLYSDPLDLPPHHMSRWHRSTFASLEQQFNVSLDKCVNEKLPSYDYDRYLRVLQASMKLSPIVSNSRFTIRLFRVYRRLLNLGVSKLLAGQCLYAQFIKLA